MSAVEGTSLQQGGDLQRLRLGESDGRTASIAIGIYGKLSLILGLNICRLLSNQFLPADPWS
jgi:hypothetical protein